MKHRRARAQAARSAHRRCHDLLNTSLQAAAVGFLATRAASGHLSAASLTYADKITRDYADAITRAREAVSCL